MKERIKKWYWRHWEAFDLLESIVTSREAKFFAGFIATFFALVLWSKMYVETSFNLVLVGNHPIVDIWFLSVTFGFGAGILFMCLLDRIR